MKDFNLLLYAGNLHLSNKGTFLVTSSFYATIFKQFRPAFWLKKERSIWPLQQLRIYKNVCQKLLPIHFGSKGCVAAIFWRLLTEKCTVEEEIESFEKAVRRFMQESPDICQPPLISLNTYADFYIGFPLPPRERFVRDSRY